MYLEHLKNLIWRRKVKLVIMSYTIELLMYRDPKFKGHGEKRVTEWFGLRNGGLDMYNRFKT